MQYISLIDQHIWKGAWSISNFKENLPLNFEEAIKDFWNAIWVKDESGKCKRYPVFQLDEYFETLSALLQKEKKQINFYPVFLFSYI